MILQILETGKALYLLASICFVGIFTKWLIQNRYRRLLKESENMSLTKNKYLREFKQKTENTYRMNQGIPHVKPYLEKQMYDFKFLKISLNGWVNFSNQMTLLSFLAGGITAFGAYWYRCDSYYTVLYGSMGILGGLVTILADHTCGTSDKKQQLFVFLDDYLENNLLHRFNQEREQDVIYLNERRESMMGSSREKKTGVDFDSSKMEQSQQLNLEEKDNKLLLISSQKDNSPVSESKEPSEAVSVNGLKRSLEQIAASREKDNPIAGNENWLKNLNQEEVSIISEIIKEYLT